MASGSGTLRDALILVAAFGLLLGGLYVYTGVWPPAVIVESGSMMHADDEVGYGRVGTIDPGDLVLVKAVDGVDDVGTLVEGSPSTYGKAGDVIVYFPRDNRLATPIIHRAVAYVELAGTVSEPEYRVRWNPEVPCEGGARKSGAWCVYGEEGVTIPSVPVDKEKPRHSGFLTKGDNPSTNRQIDQDTGLSEDQPVRLSWIQGVARAEVPWLGLIKLSLAPKYNQDCAFGKPEFHFFDEAPSARCAGWVAFGHAWAPKDLWVMLGVTLFLLIVVPLGVDFARARIAKREDGPDAMGEAPPAEPSVAPDAPAAREPAQPHAPPPAAPAQPHARESPPPPPAEPEEIAWDEPPQDAPWRPPPP